MNDSQNSTPRSAPQSRHPLVLAEYASGAASILGWIVAIVSRQVVFAAAPLTLLVFLNVINRQRFEQQTQQALNNAIAQVQTNLEQWSQRVHTLQQSPAGAASASEAEHLRQAIAEIELQLLQIGQRQPELTQEIHQLQARLAQLHQSITGDLQTIQQQVQAFEPLLDALTILPQGLSNLQNRLSALEAQNSTH